MQAIIDFILKIFSGISSTTLGKEITVFIISMLPMLESRGGLIASALLGLDPFRSYVISLIGNILPVPLILLFMNKILLWCQNSKIKFLNKFANWLDKKVDKNRGTIEKYGYLGLILFVGIPLPGTGAWTGCLVASALELDKRKSFPCIILGIIMASIIMMILSFGILKNII